MAESATCEIRQPKRGRDHYRYAMLPGAFMAAEAIDMDPMRQKPSGALTAQERRGGFTLPRRWRHTARKAFRRSPFMST